MLVHYRPLRLKEENENTEELQAPAQKAISKRKKRQRPAMSGVRRRAEKGPGNTRAHQENQTEG